jgi:hypothetical protein
MLLTKPHLLRRTQHRLELIRTLNKCRLFSNKQNEMVSVKTAITLQYYFINRHKNLKRKILKCNSKIYFNKQFVNTGQAPKYARIKKHPYEGKIWIKMNLCGVRLNKRTLFGNKQKGITSIKTDLFTFAWWQPYLQYRPPQLPHTVHCCSRL